MTKETSYISLNFIVQFFFIHWWPQLLLLVASAGGRGGRVGPLVGAVGGPVPGHLAVPAVLLGRGRHHLRLHHLRLVGDGLRHAHREAGHGLHHLLGQDPALERLRVAQGVGRRAGAEPVGSGALGGVAGLGLDGRRLLLLLGAELLCDLLQELVPARGGQGLVPGKYRVLMF